jgi:hypothetical protein
MQTNDDPKLYRFQNAPDYFLAGHLTDGTQVLMNLDAVSLDHLLALRFDAGGNLLDTLTKEILPEPSYKKRIEWLASEDGWKKLEDWANELGLTEGTIAVKKFCLLEHEVYIQDIPEHLQEILDANAGTAELDDDIKEELQYWQDSGMFVFVWYTDYHISKDGEIVST